MATRAASAASRLDLRSDIVAVFLLTSHRSPHFLNLQLSLDQRVKGFRKTQVLESDIRGLAEPAGDVPQLLLHTGQGHLGGTRLAQLSLDRGSPGWSTALSLDREKMRTWSSSDLAALGILSRSSPSTQ